MHSLPFRNLTEQEKVKEMLYPEGFCLDIYLYLQFTICIYNLLSVFTEYTARQ